MYSPLLFAEKLGLKTGDSPLRLPKVFSDHMVLQQGKPVPVWGLSKAGAKVTVIFQDQTLETNADKYGSWIVKLAPLSKTFEAQTMTVKASTGEEIKISDILIGEVWLCSGQSNMEMGIKACYHGDELVKNANHPNLRILTTVNKTSYTPRFDIDTRWAVCTPETAGKGTFGGFCAIGYFFARRLMEEIDAPIGVINSSWGGTPIRSYVPPEGFEMTKGMEGNVYDVNKQRKLYETSLVNTYKRSEEWKEKVAASLESGEIMPPPPKPPKYPTPYENCSIYNTQIHPLVPFAVKGFLWYQAEYDVIDRPCGQSYYQKMHALVDGWRRIWGEDLPFYYVQIAPWHYVAIYTHRNEIIDAQTRSLDIPNTGMALAYDTADDLANIHPMDKKPLAVRLANLALYEQYGKTELKPYFPKVKSVELEGTQAKLTFDFAYDGLITSDGKDPDCFEVAGSDKVFHPAEAKITGPDQVTISAPEVKNVQYVQFGRGLLDRPNLRNSVGLSANTFTTLDTRLIEGNLAFGKPVASNYETYLDCGPEYLTDGVTDNGSAWEGTRLGQTATIDLEAPTVCDTVAIYPYADGLSAQRYTLEISLDGESWERIGIKNNGIPDKPCEEYTFGAKPIRYVRFKILYTN
ncbi:discoidin domain-containing protein [bacterium]|nr:discoidin domain-containing protein [bacterium]